MRRTPCSPTPPRPAVPRPCAWTPRSRLTPRSSPTLLDGRILFHRSEISGGRPARAVQRGRSAIVERPDFEPSSSAGRGCRWAALPADPREAITAEGEFRCPPRLPGSVRFASSSGRGKRDPDWHAPNLLELLGMVGPSSTRARRNRFASSGRVRFRRPLVFGASSACRLSTNCDPDQDPGAGPLIGSNS